MKATIRAAAIHHPTRNTRIGVKVRVTTKRQRRPCFWPRALLCNVGGMLIRDPEVMCDVLVVSWLHEAEVIEHLPDDALSSLASDEQVRLVDADGRIEAFIDARNFGCK